MPSQAPSSAATNDIWMPAQSLKQRLRSRDCLADEMFGGVSSLPFNSFTNIHRRLFAKTFELGDPPFFACLFKFLNCFDPELVVQRLDLLWTDTWNLQHGDQARGRGSFEILIVLELSRGH